MSSLVCDLDRMDHDLGAGTGEHGSACAARFESSGPYCSETFWKFIMLAETEPKMAFF